MRLIFRFVAPLVIILGVSAYAVVPLVDALTFRWFIRDIDIRTKLISNTIQDSLSVMGGDFRKKGISRLFSRLIQDERLYALGLCDLDGHFLHKTETFPVSIQCFPGVREQAGTGQVLRLPNGPLHVSSVPVMDVSKQAGSLILVHDLGFIQRRSEDTKAYIVYLFALLGALISILTVLIAWWSWKSWIKGVRSALRADGLLAGLPSITAPEIRPIVKDLRTLVQELQADLRTRDESQISWNPSALKTILQHELAGDEVLIVSNREPYIHVRKNSRIEIQFPASGLVTALEPVMRACSGTWIAHGSGTGDKESVDKHDHIKVPPEDPTYQIRRVWLTKEEEAGYYYGFSNEGIWPLCHIAHVRPTFRSQDWAHYVAVNEKFAKAVVEEAKTDNPVVLVQDYHLALLPRMVRNLLPKATIISFWHIPFPNPEVFGICPWRESLLDGMLGSNIIGFHTRSHCNNFLDTLDRYLEARIDRDSSTVSFGKRLTAVNAYPISIEYPSKHLRDLPSVQECRSEIRKRHNFPDTLLLGVGVDRLDYTKGIVERFLAVERLLELCPEWIGKFTFIQIAAPSRTSIDEYRRFEFEVRALADRINHRFGTERYQPISLNIDHFDPASIYKYYRGAEICFVSSLHDGMNLVAKEFLSARDDEQGVLILSQFAGASKELPEALIVNPYSIEQCAAALHLALEMPVEEQRNRIRSMRNMIQEFNVYRWAGRMLMDAGRIRKQRRVLGDINLLE